MTLRAGLFWTGVLAGLPFVVRGQNAPPAPPAPRVAFRTGWDTIAQLPIPNDPLEVAVNAQPVQDATQRATAMSLVANARALSNVRAYPYDLKSTFTASGSQGSDGNWQMEDTVPKRGVYRWTAQGPSYSAVNLFSGQLLYSNQPATGIPLRLMQVRSAIFFWQRAFGPRAGLRTAAGTVNGTEVTCVLVGAPVMRGAAEAAGPRRWDEAEFCVDPKSGLLVSYSPVPTLYTVYDYSNAVHFHDKVLAGKFTVSEAGQTVIEGQIVSAADPANLDASLFNPTGLNPIGVGGLMTGASFMRTLDILPDDNAGAAPGVVVLHGMIAPNGKLSELQVLASTNQALNQPALNRAAQWPSWRAADDEQQGLTPQSHEVIFTIGFLSPPAS